MPVKVLSFINNKGGVGKTTCTTIFAEFLAIVRKKRVLVIDLDGQCNTSRIWIRDCKINTDGLVTIPIHPHFDPNDPDDVENLNPRSAITDIFWGKQVLSHPTMIGPEGGEEQPPGVGLVEVIACNREHMRQALGLHKPLSEVGKDNPFGKFDIDDLIKNMYTFLQSSGLEFLYDYVLIDSAPSESSMFHIALASSTFVVTPYEPTSSSTQNIPAILTNLRTHNQRQERFGRKRIKFIGCLPNKVRPHNAQKEAIEFARTNYSQFHLPEDIQLKNLAGIATADEQHLSGSYTPIFNRRPSDPARQLCEKVFGYIADQMEVL